MPAGIIDTEQMDWGSVINEEIQTEGINWTSVENLEVPLAGINWDALDDHIDNGAINWDDMSPIDGQVICWNGNALGTCDNQMSVSGTCSCV